MILIASAIGFSAASAQSTTKVQQRHDRHVPRVAGFAAHKAEHDNKIAAECTAAPTNNKPRISASQLLKRARRHDVSGTH
jgi:hypothetical protein